MTASAWSHSPTTSKKVGPGYNLKASPHDSALQQASTSKMFTTFPNSSASWGPSALTREPVGTFHIQAALYYENRENVQGDHEFLATFSKELVQKPTYHLNHKRGR